MKSSEHGIAVRESAREETDGLNADLSRRLAERTAELRALQTEMGLLSHAVGHDLRGPLMNIGGYADLLQVHTARQLDDQGRLYLDKIVSSTNQLAQMLTDILALAKARQSKPHPADQGNTP